MVGLSAMSDPQKYPKALNGLTQDTGPDGTRAYWSDPKWRDFGLLETQTNFAAPALKSGQTLLKQARQRFIFRTETATGAAVVKLFPLTFIGSKLRHPKYAYREFCNTLEAQARGVQVPAALAFLEKRDFGLVSCSGIIQQSLEGYTDLLALHKQADLTYQQVADHAAPVLIEMFERGANHIDLRDENIMLNPDTGDKRVIDWQYARFVEKRAPWLLEYLTAYFIRLAPPQHRDALQTDWLPGVATLAGLTATEIPAFRQRTAVLIGKRAKVKQRLALTSVALP